MDTVKELGRRAVEEVEGGNIPRAAELFEEALQMAQSDPSLPKEWVAQIAETVRAAKAHASEVRLRCRADKLLHTPRVRAC